MAQRKTLKFGIFQYWKPTPVFFRKIGDTCLGISAFLAVTDNSNINLNINTYFNIY